MHDESQQFMSSSTRHHFDRLAIELLVLQTSLMLAKTNEDASSFDFRPQRNSHTFSRPDGPYGVVGFTAALHRLIDDEGNNKDEIYRLLSMQKKIAETANENRDDAYETKIKSIILEQLKSINTLFEAVGKRGRRVIERSLVTDLFFDRGMGARIPKGAADWFSQNCKASCQALSDAMIFKKAKYLLQEELMQLPPDARGDGRFISNIDRAIETIHLKLGEQGVEHIWNILRDPEARYLEDLHSDRLSERLFSLIVSWPTLAANGVSPNPIMKVMEHDARSSIHILSLFNQEEGAARKNAEQFFEQAMRSNPDSVIGLLFDVDPKSPPTQEKTDTAIKRLRDLRVKKTQKAGQEKHVDAYGRSVSPDKEQEHIILRWLAQVYLTSSEAYRASISSVVRCNELDPIKPKNQQELVSFRDEVGFVYGALSAQFCHLSSLRKDGGGPVHEGFLHLLGNPDFNPELRKDLFVLAARRLNDGAPTKQVELYQKGIQILKELASTKNPAIRENRGEQRIESLITLCIDALPTEQFLSHFDSTEIKWIRKQIAQVAKTYTSIGHLQEMLTYNRKLFKLLDVIDPDFRINLKLGKTVKPERLEALKVQLSAFPNLGKSVIEKIDEQLGVAAATAGNDRQPKKSFGSP